MILCDTERTLLCSWSVTYVTNDNAKRDGTDNMETAGSVPQLSAKIFLPPHLLVFKNVCDCILDKSSALIRAQIA